MKRLILLTALFMFAMVASAWAVTSNTTDTVEVTVTVPTFIGIDYTGSIVEFGTLTDAEMIAGLAVDTTAGTIDAWNNVAAVINATFETGGTFTTTGLTLKYSADGGTTQLEVDGGGDEHSLSAGAGLNFVINHWELSGFSWATPPITGDSATVTFTIS